MATHHRVDPRIRALGKARIDVTRRAHDEIEWQSLWREPRYPFAFKFGTGWKQCILYLVDDYPAEIGFFIDVLGFPVSAFSPNYAQFTTPGGEFHFGVATAAGKPGTPAETITMQFMLDNLQETIQELEQRGVVFEQKPEVGDADIAFAVLRTPHGVRLELWGKPVADLPMQSNEDVTQISQSVDFWGDFPEGPTEIGHPPPDLPQEDDRTELSEGDALESSLPQEPEYIDDEIEDLQGETISARGKTTSTLSQPGFQAKVIHRTEDLRESVGSAPGSKQKGNGPRNFPTLNEQTDRQ